LIGYWGTASMFPPLSKHWKGQIHLIHLESLSMVDLIRTPRTSNLVCMLDALLTSNDRWWHGCPWIIF